MNAECFVAECAKGSVAEGTEDSVAGSLWLRVLCILGLSALKVLGVHSWLVLHITTPVLSVFFLGFADGVMRSPCALFCDLLRHHHGMRDYCNLGWIFHFDGRGRCGGWSRGNLPVFSGLE